ncbi:hypothetical protein, partial [Allorhizocola rhizosphaerae]|uniref:hypothetical protein n=1 Tax=Allorhizocola rhizosphaerae TaxID=1872709 RepID=UPI0013C31D66
MTARETAIRLVLGLYPAHVRDRYGEEIADLLRHSPTPARDLANVAWTAMTEPGDTPTMTNFGRAAALVGT